MEDSELVLCQLANSSRLLESGPPNGPANPELVAQ
jgi:hypothetical protein